MTGFGRASRRGRHGDIEVEARSVNHRFLQVKMTLPEWLTRFEPEIERRVRARLNRGSVTLTVSARPGNAAGPALPDLKDVRAAYRRLREIRRTLSLKDDIALGDVLSIPSLWSGASESEVPAAASPEVFRLVERALDGLAAARSREGRAIGRELRTRLSTVERHMERVGARVAASVEGYRKRLDDRIQALLAQKGVAGAQVEIVKEVALYADRCDVSEELQRLRTHVAEFRKVLDSGRQIGRHLEFVIQEMGREANTIASKGNDAGISASAVAIKAELEKLKEQVENLE